MTIVTWCSISPCIFLPLGFTHAVLLDTWEQMLSIKVEFATYSFMWAANTHTIIFVRWLLFCWKIVILSYYFFHFVMVIILVKNDFSVHERYSDSCLAALNVGVSSSLCFCLFCVLTHLSSLHLCQSSRITTFCQFIAVSKCAKNSFICSSDAPPVLSVFSSHFMSHKIT